MRYTPFVSELVDRATQILADGEARTSAELAALLPRLDAVDDPVEFLEDVLTHCVGFTTLRDGRYAATQTVLDGLTLTRRLTAEEIDSGRVKVDPDLWALVVAYEEIPLAQGEAIVDRDGEHRIAGPPGWLGDARPGEVFAFALRDGRLDVARAEPNPEESVRVAHEIRAAFDALRDGAPYVHGSRLLLSARAAADGVFDSPVAPVSDLVTLVGLEARMDLIGLAGDDSWGPDQLASSLLADTFGYDECCVELLQLAVGAFASWDAGDAGDLVPSLLADVVGHGEVAVGLVEFGLRHLELDAAKLERFVEAIAREATGDGLARCRWLQSACAERRDDPEASERYLTAALRADHGDPLALTDAAWYADDRGDALRALEYLRRAGAQDDGRIDRLLHYSAPGPNRAGRNDACPCGSGRKHKVCCWARGGFDLPSRARWLYEKAWSFAMRPANAGRVNEVYDHRCPAGGDLSDFDFDTVVDLALFEGGVLARFLDVRGVLLPADELELGREWIGSRRLLWRIERVVQGEGMELRDLVSGRCVFVTVHTSSHKLVAGALLDARVVPDGRGHVTVGPVAMMPLQQRDAYLHLLRSNPSANEIAAWHAERDSIVLLTKENEPFVMCEAVYEIDDARAAEHALTRVLEPTPEGTFAEIVRLGEEDVARGWVEVDTSTMRLTTNSEARLERLRETVLAAVPGARLASETRTPAKKALRDGGSYGGGGRTLVTDTVLAPSLPGFQTGVEERWLDDPNPALGGLTPRQAVDDPARRPDLETLLAEMQVSGSMNARRLRALLGIRRPRRRR